MTGENEGFEAEFSSYKSGQQKYFRINLSDLKIHLRDFKNSVKSTDLSSLFIGIVGIWVPLFTSDFKSIYGFNPDMIKGIYIGIAALLTLILIKKITYYWIAKAYAFLKKKNLTKYQSDPDSLAENLYDAMPDKAKEKKVNGTSRIQ